MARLCDPEKMLQVPDEFGMPTEEELGPRGGDPRFYALLDEMRKIHAAKSHDYASLAAPLSNFTRARRFGVEPWRGALVRLGDKVARLEELTCVGKTPRNESVRDTLVDLASYALITVLLLEDAHRSNP